MDLISPEANRQKATVQVRVKVMNPDALLKPDMNATVSFLSPRKLAAGDMERPIECSIMTPSSVRSSPHRRK